MYLNCHFQQGEETDRRRWIYLVIVAVLIVVLTVSIFVSVGLSYRSKLTGYLLYQFHIRLLPL